MAFLPGKGGGRPWREGAAGGGCCLYFFIRSLTKEDNKKTHRDSLPCKKGAPRHVFLPN